MPRRTDRPVNRCAYRGCPCVGHWPPGESCPMHRDTTTTRQPTTAEMLGADQKET